jgi:signal transduction histidine kinase
MNIDMKKLIKRLIFKIFLFDIAILFVLITFSVVFTGQSKQRLAEQLSDSFRAPLIVGDNMRIMLDMSRPISKDFLGVLWKSQNGTYNFSIPERFKKPIAFFYRAVTIPIFFDENKSHLVGNLYFYYNRWISIPLALFAWICLIALSIPIGYIEKNRLIKGYNLSLKLSVQESYANLSAQVAHDIRSPLAALDSITKDIAKLPEEKRVIVRSAIGRIRDIANNLIEKNRQLPKDSSSKATVVSTSVEPVNNYLLSSLIEPIITEKHFQFRSKAGIEIITQLDKVSYGLFAKIQPIEFKRLISNLINNAVEALGDKGEVEILLSSLNDKVIIEIKDNGKGIAPEILEKLGQKGETHGKEGGSGLGLYHAKTKIESWNGKLKLQSEEGKGTSIILTLPKAKAPDWFVSKLEFKPGATVVTLDDDITIHHIWQGRYESIRAKEKDIKMFHFSEPDEFRQWVKSNQSIIQNTIFLLDYELAGYEETGLTLAEEMNIGQQTILVTSRYEEKRIIDNCIRLKIGMIPKGLSGMVPMEIKETNSNPALELVVLIDDDALVIMNWKMAAKKKGINLKTFKEPKEFLDNIENYSKEAIIYIDSELADDIKGEDVAKELSEKGFKNIYIETGHDKEKFSHLKFIKEIIGKEPPWA